MIAASDFPPVNATLNAASAVLISLGYYFIRTQKVSAHKCCMLGAVGTSALFLICYLTYHFGFRVGSFPFKGSGWVRTIYFTILFTHTVLAAAIVPLVLITMRYALNSRFVQHRSVARWTLPLWLYVSVTGVVIYWMLYRMPIAP